RPFPLCCSKAVRSVRTRLLRWRLRHPEFRCVLVLSTLWSPTCKVGGHFFLGKCSGGNFGALGFATGFAHRPGEDHGRHSPAFKYPSHSCSANAKSPAPHTDASPFFQHQ